MVRFFKDRNCPTHFYWLSNSYERKNRKINLQWMIGFLFSGFIMLVSMAFSILLSFYILKNKIGREKHMLSLILGGIGLISIYFMPNKKL